MTEVATDPTPEPTAIPAPEPAPASPQQPDVQSLLQSAGYSDVSTALEHAKQYRQANKDGVYDTHRTLQSEATRLGYANVQTMIDDIRQIQADEQQQQQQQQQPTQLDQDALEERIANRLNQTLDKRMSEQAANAEKAAQARTQAEAEQRARFAEDEFARKTLEAAGFKVPDDGNLDLTTRTLASSFYAALEQAKSQEIPRYMSDQVREDMLKAQATSEQLEAAKVAVGQMLHALKTKAVAEFAQGQQQLPDGTLAGGPSGTNAPPKTLDQMNHDEELAWAKSVLPELNGLD